MIRPFIKKISILVLSIGLLTTGLFSIQINMMATAEDPNNETVEKLSFRVKKYLKQYDTQVNEMVSQYRETCDTTTERQKKRCANIYKRIQNTRRSLIKLYRKNNTKLKRSLKNIPVKTVTAEVKNVGLATTSTQRVKPFGLQEADNIIENLPSIALKVTSLINLERRSEGLIGLKYNSLLEEAALSHVDDMKNRGYFNLESPDGVTPRQRVETTGYTQDLLFCDCVTDAKFKANIILGYDDPRLMIEEWMKSPKNRANILNPDFKDIGFATNGQYSAVYFGYAVFGDPIERSDEDIQDNKNSGINIDTINRIENPTAADPDPDFKQNDNGGNVSEVNSIIESN